MAAWTSVEEINRRALELLLLFSWLLDKEIGSIDYRVFVHCLPGIHFKTEVSTES